MTNPSAEAKVAQVAYDTREQPYKGFSVRASYLKPPSDRDALIEIFREGELWRSYHYPAYRIYNVVAHFTEIVDREIEEIENPSAHVAAGVTGHD